MKRRSILGSLLSLLILVALAVGLIFVFPGFQGWVKASFFSPGMPVETPATPPAYPPPGETRSAEPAGTPWSDPTRMPYQGIRVGPLQTITFSTTEMMPEGLFRPDLDGDILVASARVTGGVALLAVDLQTGQLRQLAPLSERGFMGVTVSGHRVAWVDPTPRVDADQRSLHIFDLEKGVESIIPDTGWGLRDDIDLKDNLLVWQAQNGAPDNLSLYGMDLETGQRFVVTDAPGINAAPRVCSSEWIAYLWLTELIQPDHSDSQADLRIHNLKTGEDILLGQIAYPLGNPGEQHACDGSHLAWISRETEQQTIQGVNISGQKYVVTQQVPVYQQRLYDLTTRTEQTLDIRVNGGVKVMLDGDILISSVGYDFKSGALFNYFPISDLPISQRVGGYRLLSDDRVVWLTGDRQRLYLAPIVRDGRQP